MQLQTVELLWQGREAGEVSRKAPIIIIIIIIIIILHDLDRVCPFLATSYKLHEGVTKSFRTESG
jgi:hypothetical protein